MFEKLWSHPRVSSWISLFERSAVGASLMLLAVHTFFGITGSYVFNQFDGALRVAAHLWAQMGLVPYRDFGVVYPPGQFLLFGQIFPFTLLLRSVVFTLVVVTNFLLSVVLVKELKKHSVAHWFPLALVGLASGACVQLFFLGSDIFPLLLVSLSALVMHTSLSTSLTPKTVAIWLATLGVATVFFRWDWPIIFTATQVAAFLISAVVLMILREKLTRLFPWAWSLMAYGAGVLLGLGLLVLYFAQSGTLEQGWQFIVTIPVHVILPFRRIEPDLSWRLWKLSSTLSASIFVWLGTSLLSLGSIVVFSKRKSRGQALISSLQALVLPATTLTYALGRADWEHALPFLALSILTLVLTARSWKYPLLAWGVLAMALLPLTNLLLLRHFPQIPWEWNKAQHSIERELANCRELTAKTPAQSVFVGRTSYNSFVINTAMLYLVRLDLPPATPYITDEPGLQNSCEYGKKIHAHLLAAPQPILTFLEEKPQKPEANRTQTMLSCGSIESYLAENEYTTLGSCQAYGKTFTVRLYK